MKSIKLLLNDESILVLDLINIFLNRYNYNFLISENSIDGEVLLINSDQNTIVRLFVINKITKDIYDDDIEGIRTILEQMDLDNISEVINLYFCRVPEDFFELKKDDLIKTFIISKIEDITDNQLMIEKFENIDKYMKEDLKKTSQSIINQISQPKKNIRDILKIKTREITTQLIIINIVIWLLVNLVNVNNIAASIAFGAYYRPFVVYLNEYWRFITTGFVHIEIIHLATNMYSLYFVGKLIETIYGCKKMLVIYFVSILSGSMMAHIGGQSDLIVGASGGIFGLFGALTVYTFMFKERFNPQFRTSLLYLLLINIMISFIPGVSFLGHYGGLITGGLIGYTLISEDKLQKINLIILNIALIVVMAFIVLFHANKSELYLKTDRQVIETYQKINLDFIGEYYQNKINNRYWED